jgi:hypothetical protein
LRVDAGGKRKMSRNGTSVLDDLKARFPSENVEPFGECLIVPLKAFSKQTEDLLKRQGYRVRFQGHRGETCAFVQLSKQTKVPNKMESAVTVLPSSEESPKKEDESKPLTRIEDSSIQQPDDDSAIADTIIKGPWSPEDKQKLQEYLDENLPAPEIAKRLRRSPQSVGGAISARAKKLKIKPEPKPEETRSQPEPPPIPDEDSGLFKEILSACNLLYPTHKRVCALLLKEASDKILEGSQC